MNTDRLLVHVLLLFLSAALPAWANDPAGRQVLVETCMLRVDASRMPAAIRQFFAPPSTNPAVPTCLTPDEHQQLLKAVNEGGGEVLPSSTVLLLDGTQAQVSTLSMRRYVEKIEPQQQLSADGHTIYLPCVQDAESGTKLKVKANVSDDGRSIRLQVSPQLLNVLDLQTFTFETETHGRKTRLCIQQPRSEVVSLDTVVLIPDGQTLVLGGQTVGDKPSPQTLLVLVRPVIVRRETQAATCPANPAAITIQTRLVTLSRNFAEDIGLPTPIAGTPPSLDDAQAQKLFRVIQAIRSSATTIPSVTVSNGQEALVQTTTPTSYVGTFSVAKDAAGKPAYEPKTESIDQGVSFRIAATAVPDQGAVNISADLVVNSLAGIVPFAFLDKPARLTVQQPQWSTMSAKVMATIPDKHWTVISSWQIEGKVVRESRVAIPVIGRFLGTNRSEARDTMYTYLLVRPELLEQMPAAVP